MKVSSLKVIVPFVVLAVQVPIASADQWSDFKAKGRNEGVVVVSTNVGNKTFREGLANLFQKKYGIRVDLRVQRSSATDAILIRECAVGRPTIDLAIGGNGSAAIYDKGCYAPIKPLLVLPEVVDGKNWRGGKLKFNDAKREYLLETITSIYGWVVVNSNQIKPGELTVAKDLLRPQYRGKIAAFDPRRGGAGQNFASYLEYRFGDKLIKDLFVGQKVTYTRSYPQLGEWVARGSYAIGLGGTARGIEKFRKAGLPIKVVKLKDTAYAAGSVGVMRLTKGAPHPNAAAVFINWFTSKEGQQLFTRAIHEPSRRVDVSIKGVPEYLVPQPGVKYFDTYDYKYNFTKHPEIKKKLQALLGH